jgi:hypothetical protein
MPLIRREIAAIDPTVPISEDRPLTGVQFSAPRVSCSRASARCVVPERHRVYGVVAATASQRA